MDRQKPARASARGSCSGDPSAVVPPVPIPNTEVKRCSPDGSASLGCARVGRCQNPPSPWFSMGRVFYFSRSVLTPRPQSAQRTLREGGPSQSPHAPFSLSDLFLGCRTKPSHDAHRATASRKRKEPLAMTKGSYSYLRSPRRAELAS